MHTHKKKNPVTQWKTNEQNKAKQIEKEKQNKNKHNRAILQNHRRKTHMSKSKVVYLHIKALAFKNKI